MRTNRLGCFAACLVCVIALAGCGGGDGSGGSSSSSSSAGNTSGGNSGGGGTNNCTTPEGFENDAGPDQHVKTGALVRLDGSGSHNPGGNLNFNWSFTSRPKGSNAKLDNATSPQPTFNADVDGDYVVKLVVGNVKCKGDSVTITSTRKVANSAPDANAGRDQNVKTGLVATLNGSASSDAEQNKLTYRWALSKMPKGSQTALTNVSSATPKFTPDVPGKYVAKLIVNDGTVDSKPDTVTVTAAQANSVPVADAGPDQSAVNLQSLVKLDGSGSNDADNDSLKYKWELRSTPKGASAKLNNASTAKPSFTPDKVGIYLVRLIVNDGHVDSSPDNVVVIARPVLALYVDRGTSGSPDYQKVSNGAKSDEINLEAGTQNAVLNRFRLKAVGQQYTISNLQYTASDNDSGPKAEPQFGGLSDGIQIAKGQTLDFSTQLKSVPANTGTYNNIALKFTVDPGGNTYQFQYNVNVK